MTEKTVDMYRKAREKGLIKGIGRRTVILDAAKGAAVLEAGALLVACRPPEPVVPTKAGPVRPQPTLTKFELEAQNILSKINSEIDRLSASYPEGSIIRKVYRGKLSEVNPIYPNNPKLRLADFDRKAAELKLTELKRSPKARFSFRANNSNSAIEYSTIDAVDVSILFPPEWLLLSDEAKNIILEMEGLGLAILEGFANDTILGNYQAQGKIEKIDPSVTDAEIAHSQALRLLTSNQDLNKLFSYAGYLAVFKSISKLEESGNKKALEELDKYSILMIMYRKAENLKIPFRDLEVGTQEFSRIAFGRADTSWVKLILDPSTPGALPFLLGV